LRLGDNTTPEGKNAFAGSSAFDNEEDEIQKGLQGPLKRETLLLPRGAFWLTASIAGEGEKKYQVRIEK